MGREGGEAMRAEPGLIERIEARVALAVSAFEAVEIKAELPHLSALAKVGADLTRWVKLVEDARTSARKADVLGDKVEAGLRALTAGAARPTRDLVFAPQAEEANMDADGNPTTPEELAEFNRELDGKLVVLGYAPEQKSLGSRAQRRRERAVAQGLARKGARGSAGA